MPETVTPPAQAREELSDEQVVERVLAGETPLFEILMRRYNQRLYRVARAILRDDSEAEDVMQEAYVRAYQHLNQFAGRAKFSTWLTRIAVHEALARSYRRNRFADLASQDRATGDLETADPMSNIPSKNPNPEQDVASSELRALLEKSILNLPESYRSVLMLRDMEEMSTAETAECLQISEENVKVRLHRARALLRRELYAQTGRSFTESFQFHAVRCDRVVRNVFDRIAQLTRSEIHLVC
jgi:RNA polymerase sigma-70 factor (ECF subfamily)